MGRDKRRLEYPAFDSLFHRQLNLSVGFSAFG